MSECSCSEMKAGGSPGIAVIGSGSLINDMVGSYSRLGVLRLVCDKNRAVLDHFRTCHPNTDVCAAFYEVLTRDDIQGIAVSGPVETHFRLALEALLAGKHVFLQSPLVQNEVDGHQLLSLAEEEGLVLMSGHPVLYHPAFVKLEEMVRSGVLGKIRYIHTSRFSPGTVGREESVTESFSPRDIAMILAMAGETPETITASGGSYLHKKIPDVMNTHITFPSGLQAQVFVSWLHPFEEQRMVVIGENRTAIFDDTRPWDRKLSLLTHPVDWKHRVPRFDEAEAEPVPVSEADPFHSACEHFLNCVATKTAPRTGAHDELRLFKVLKAAEKSLEEGGKKVRIAKSSVAQTIDDYFVHETASVDENVFIGKGSKIWHFSHIMSGARMGTNCVVGQNVVIGPLVSIGNNCRIQNNVSVYKGVILEDGVFCGPSMVFTNIYNPRAEIQKVEQIRPTLVRKGATIGANATIVCGITIGKYAFVGAGAVVNRDVLDFALVVGNPARQVGWVCECGERLPDDLLCPECGKQYEKTNDGQIGKIIERLDCV